MGRDVTNRAGVAFTSCHQATSRSGSRGHADAAYGQGRWGGGVQMKPLKRWKKDNSIVTDALFAGSRISRKIWRVKYLDPEDEDYLASKWEVTAGQFACAFTVDWTGMCQKLVHCEILEERHPKPPLTCTMPWTLDVISFVIPEFKHQHDLLVEGPVLFVSDLHLGSADVTDDQVVDSLVCLLETVKPQFLILLGDVIDVWAMAGLGSVEEPKVVAAVDNMRHHVERLCRKTHAVLYIIGNHDGAIGQVGNLNRNLLQFNWLIDNLVVCEELCLRGRLPIPEFGNQMPAFAFCTHGHELSPYNKPTTRTGRRVACAYQSAVKKPLLRWVKSARPLIERTPHVGDREHRQLRTLGSRIPVVSFVAGHTHRPFATRQRCRATFGAIGRKYPAIHNWYRLYINIGTWGYSNTFLLINGSDWTLGVHNIGS